MPLKREEIFRSDGDSLTSREPTEADSLAHRLDELPKTLKPQ